MQVLPCLGNLAEPLLRALSIVTYIREPSVQLYSECYCGLGCNGTTNRDDGELRELRGETALGL